MADWLLNVATRYGVLAIGLWMVYHLIVPKVTELCNGAVQIVTAAMGGK